MMLVMLVEKKGKNWDKLLAYRTTPHSLTGETPFFLMYRHIPTRMDFYVPIMRNPTIESEYGKELFKELKQV